MSNPPPGFQLDTPPAGFKMDKPATRGILAPVLLDRARKDQREPFTMTGEAIDGDTVRPQTGPNVRLFGIDAPELRQPGYLRDGSTLPIGQQSRTALQDLMANQPVTFGPQQGNSYGRPVAPASVGDADIGGRMIRDGNAFAAPDYLGSDPTRRFDYLQNERLARLNRLGVHDAYVQDPADYRADRDYVPDRQTVARFWDEPTPFAGMRPEAEKQYLGMLLGDGTVQQVVEFVKSQGGFNVDPAEVQAFIAKRDAAKAKGEPLNVDSVNYRVLPPPLTNVGDGAFGAGVRSYGAGVLANGLDELGAVADTLGATPGRENVWNSDARLADIWANNQRQNASILGYDEYANPGVTTAGLLAGAVTAGLAIPYGMGARTVPQLARVGAAYGAPAGFLGSNGEIGERLTSGVVGAGAGAALNAVGGKALQVALPALGRGVQRLRGRGAEALDLPTASPSPRAIDRIEIPQRQPGPLPLPAAGERVPSAYPGPVPGKPPLLADVLPKVDEWAKAQAEGTMFHGSPRSGITEFDPYGRADYGLFGQGTYLTDNPAIAASYTAKGMKRAGGAEGRTIYGVNQSVRNPLDMDAPADLDAWKAAAGEYTDAFRPGMTNEEAFREVEGAITHEMLPKWEGAEMMNNVIRGMGHDGVTHIGGGRFGRGDGPRHKVVIALDPEQTEITGSLSVGDLMRPTMRERSWIDVQAQEAPPEGFVLDALRARGDDMPPLALERQRDVIDVNAARPTRLMDDPTEAAMQAAAARVEPQDVLPRAVDPALPADDIAPGIPPATANDDWNEAVASKVGNVRIDKLESPQDIEQALKVADIVGSGFDAARRGKIGFAETQALAQDLGMTADDLLARRKGQAFSAEEAYAARSILAKSGNELVNIAKRIKSLGSDPGSEALAAFRKALVRHTAIQEQVSGMTAEAGRALSAFRMAADSRDVPGRVLEGLATAGKGTGRLQDAADRIVDLAEDPANLNRFVEKVSKPTFADRAQEIWYNYLLSGPQTHMVNTLSNTMTALGQIPEHAVAAGVGAARRAISREATDRVLFSELGARSLGLLQGTKEGIREFARAFKTGESSDFVTKMDTQTQKAVPGLMGDVLRVPTRMLTAEDELFKAMARRMELSGLAVRQAASEGRTGQEAKDRVAELVANPPDEMMEKVLDYGRYLTFQRPLGDGLAGTLSRYSQNHPMIKAVLPFVRTPTNLIKFTAERSPLAPFVKEWRKDIAAGGARRDLAVAKVMVGSGVGAVIAELAAKGIVTGSAPSDDNQRGLLLANGWQPYSIKIGDTYYSYRRLDPFAMTFGTAADVATMGDTMTDKQREKGAALWTASVVANLASRTWLSGVTDALEALQDPERYSGNFIKRLVGSATVPTGSAQLARIVDPTMRETPDIASYMSSRVPGQSDELLPKRDVWGQPIVGEGGVGPDILSPIWTTTDRNDPITTEALRVGATVSKPQKGDMTPEQYDRLQETAGAVARQWIGQLIASPEYQALDTEAQADEIGDLMTKARKAAKANVMTGEPIPDDRPVKRQRGMAGNPPPGFVIDPPPAGFVLDQ